VQTRLLRSWFSDNALNAAAYLSLLVAPPVKARAFLKRMSSVCPKINTLAEARKTMDRLGNRGSCLSRSLSIAIRCPGSEVVIGVVPLSKAPEAGKRRGRRPIDAHAWVELGGIPLLDGPPQRWTEVGRM